jgi:hypothetical protein
MLPEHARYLLRHNPLRRDPRSRTGFLLNPDQADYRLPRSRPWTTGDLNPVPPACRAGALPDELVAQGRRGEQAAAAVPAGMAACRWCSRYGRVKLRSHSPAQGGDPQGRRDSNSRQRSFGGCCSTAELRPYENGNRPSGLSLGRLPSYASSGVTRQPS